VKILLHGDAPSTRPYVHLADLQRVQTGQVQAPEGFGQLGEAMLGGSQHALVQIRVFPVALLEIGCWNGTDYTVKTCIFGNYAVSHFAHRARRPGSRRASFFLVMSDWSASGGSYVMR
jgi:hypothetical protein